MMDERLYRLDLRDGSVSIMTVLGDADAHDQASQLPYYPDIVKIEEITRKDIPQDRTFRDAWGHDLKVDMPRAREIGRNRLREARGARLTALDGEFMRAMEKGDAKGQADIAKRKQVLRDWPGRIEIENAKTPDALVKALDKIVDEAGN